MCMWLLSRLSWGYMIGLLVKTSTNRNIDNQNVDNPKHRQTETSTNQNVDKPNVDNPKRRQTKTSTPQNISIIQRYMACLIITHALTSTVDTGVNSIR